MDTNYLIIFLACIIFIFLISKFLSAPLKLTIKLIGNSLLGGCLIFLVNLIGGMFEFHIGLNVITTIFVGILGIPRSNFINNFKNIFIDLV